MSNNSNNNITRNVYNSSARSDEMAMLLDQSNAPDDTTINMENDMGPSTSQQHQQRLLHLNTRRESNTRINMDSNGGAVAGGSSGGTGGVSISVDGTNPNVDDRRIRRNLFSMLREARHQLHRQSSSRDHHLAGTATSVNNGGDLPTGSHTRTWRENLYDVLASPVTPRTDVLRAFFTPSSSGNIRYNSLSANDNHTPEEHFHFLLNSNSIDQDIQTQHHRSHPTDIDIGVEAQSSNNSGLRLSRQNSRLDDRSGGDNTPSVPTTPPTADPLDAGGSRRQSSNGASSAANGGRLSQRQSSVAGSTAAPTIEMDDPDTNAMGEMVVKLVSHFVRYLPFICILLVKFIHDHLLGILDLIVLHAVMYHINKSLKEQVAKINQKSFAILTRDTIMVICIVAYRFILSTSMPDPFGLLINPPGDKITLDLSLNTPAHENTDGLDGTLDPVRNYLKNIVSLDTSKHDADEISSDPTSNPLNNSTIALTKTVSLGVLLYYVAVNDLILKLLTQLVKIQVTMLPTKMIRHKSRARLYALVEYISQFYRALAPMRQWLTFLFESYTGLEIISGILFSSFYLGAKGFEFVERGKCLKKALVNFIRNMDYDRKPTKDELDAAGTVCPICHDAYTTPVVLECGHIFCDECVNTWFKREQTCPMCRAKVSEDPTWQDGATSYFYQLF